MRDQIRKGIDPLSARRKSRARLAAEQARAITFDECVRQFMISKRQGLRNAKHIAQWTSTIERHASPVIGKLPVDQIELAHIVKILEPIWSVTPETAKRTRGRIENVLAWATVRGYRSGDNPARWRGHLDMLFPAPSRVRPVNHFRAMNMDDMPAFMTALRERKAVAARALEFVIHTATRSGEVRGARWSEIDLDKRLWTIPAERMKAQRAHIVPLSDDAVTLLKNLPRLVTDYDLVFPAPRGGEFSDMALSALLKRMNVDATVHGFRSTFRDWCAERTGHPHEVAEMALAHVIPSAVERAYRRGDLLVKRTQLMADWARFVGSSPGKVIKLEWRSAG